MLGSDSESGEDVGGPADGRFSRRKPAGGFREDSGEDKAFDEADWEKKQAEVPFLWVTFSSVMNETDMICPIRSKQADKCNRSVRM